MILGCLYPRLVFNKYLNKKVQVPCGRCYACRAMKANEWSNRLEMESCCHKYTLFGTLTYQDDYLPRIDITQLGFVSDTFEKSCDLSSDFIAYHNNCIPFCSTRDFSLYIKRIRKELSLPKYGLSKEERCIRYFCTTQYGPTTFRPHFHYLLWYDSPRVHKIIKECIYKSWYCKNPHPSISSFFRRNRHELVISSAARYVANYIVASSELPPLLFEAPFREKHIQSQSPSIGYSYISDVQIRRLSDGVTNKISFVNPRTHKSVRVSCWSSLKSRLFPRCLGFAELSSRDRIAMYGFPASEFISFEEFKMRFFSKWFAVAGVWFVIKAQILYGWKDVSEPLPSSEVERNRIVNSLKRIYYTSRSFLRTCCEKKCSVQSFVAEIEDFYRKQDYLNLVEQIKFQVECSNRPVLGVAPLKYYPCIIDSGFFNNEREIPFSHYETICQSFGIDCTCSDFNHERSFEFIHSFDIFSLICFKFTKNVRKKDYLARHPEFAQMYSSNLFMLNL